MAEPLSGLIARTFARLYPEAVAGMVRVDAAEEQHAFGRLDVLRSAARRQLAPVRVLLPLGLIRRAIGRNRGWRYSARDCCELASALSRRSHWRAALDEIAAYDLTPSDQCRAGGFGPVVHQLTVIAYGRPFQGANADLEDGWREGRPA